MTELTVAISKKMKYCFSIFLLSIVMIGCSSTPNQMRYYSSFPVINKLIEEKASFSKIESEVEIALKNRELKKPIFRGRGAEITRVIYLTINSNVNNAITSLATESPEQTEVYIELGLTLFPLLQKQIVDGLLLNETISEEEVLNAAISAGMDPYTTLPSTASGVDPIVTPLIHSASITLFNQTESTENILQYRDEESDEWIDGFSLSWEPTRSALSGSIIKLEPNTNYIARVTTLIDGSPTNEYTLQFKTRPNLPTINPNLVYYLSDIYSGSGMLDLELLNIKGEEDGWAKIIGDADTPILANEQDDYGINIGNNSYIMFENITVKGGHYHGIYSEKAHHLWFKGCNVSNWGRETNYVKNGKSYEDAEDTKPINYDAGFYLFKSGVIVVENCEVHSPKTKANHWGYGHPMGATAYLVLANHPEKSFQGQHILRYNKFFGTPEHRFNDVIESRSNGRKWGGFLRDSAIYSNYLAYANDDIIELDGGQSNVLVYNNEIEQGFCGISAVPNMIGPNYIFNNFIHSMNDERGGSWAAIKLGGLLSSPAGKSHIFNNLIITKSNGISQVRWQGDRTYWMHAQNNIIVNTFFRDANYNKGLAILDSENYQKSNVENNFFFNNELGATYIDAEIDVSWQAPKITISEDDKFKEKTNYKLEIPKEYILKNFSFQSDDGYSVIGIKEN